MNSKFLCLVASTFLVMLGLIVQAHGQASWTQQDIGGTTSNYSAVDSIPDGNTYRVVAGAASGVVRSTLDGVSPTSWISASAGISTTFTCTGVAFGSSTNVVWLVGRRTTPTAGATIYRSTEWSSAAPTWGTAIVYTTITAFRAVAAVDDLIACAVGTGGAVRYTNNGGALIGDWSSATTNSAHTLYAVSLVLVDTTVHGYAIGDDGTNGVVWHTSGSGTTWGATWNQVTTTPSFTGIRLRGVKFISDQEGWAIGNDGTNYHIYHTINGGSNWEESPSTPAAGTLNAIDMINIGGIGRGEAVGVVGLDNLATILITRDETIWSRENTDVATGVTLNGVSIAHLNNCWAVGNSGNIWYSNDQALPVFLSSFTAKFDTDKVVLKWVTDSELNNLGFNIYRSESADGNFIKINGKLIAGAIDSGARHKYQFVDTDVQEGVTYYYQIEYVSTKGLREKSQIIKTKMVEQFLPEMLVLLQNFPNFFNPDTWIPYKLSKDAVVKILIHNAKGELIRTINLGQKSAGFYLTKENAAYWNGKNDRGEPVASGIYYYTLLAKNFSATRKMALLK